MAIIGLLRAPCRFAARWQELSEERRLQLTYKKEDGLNEKHGFSQ
jgi:hypothetical protein